MKDPEQEGAVREGRVYVPYRWSYGWHAVRFFQELKENGRIMGVRCPQCQGVLVPPTLYCGRCFMETTDWVEVGPKGRALSPVNYLLSFPDQPKPPPIVISPILLDGASLAFSHILEEVDTEKLRAGMRVEAVLRPKTEREGCMEDIAYFRPVAE